MNGLIGEQISKKVQVMYKVKRFQHGDNLCQSFWQKRVSMLIDESDCRRQRKPLQFRGWRAMGWINSRDPLSVSKCIEVRGIKFGSETDTRKARRMGMSQTISDRSVVVATKDQVSCDLAGEAAILNIKSGVYYGLDPVGARIWTLMQEPRRGPGNSKYNHQ